MLKFDKASKRFPSVFVDLVKNASLIEEARALGYPKVLAPGTGLLLIEDTAKNLEKILASRPSVDLVVIASANMMKINKAVADDRTDAILLDLGKVRFSRSVASLLKRNGIAAFLPFSSLLANQSLLRRYKETLAILEAKDVPTAFPSWADGPLELRRPRELGALLTYLGCSDGFVKTTIKETLPTLIEENCQRRKMIAPGVRLK